MTPNSELVDAYSTALQHASRDDQAPSEAVDSLGKLVDLSGDLGRVDGARAAIQWADKLRGQELRPAERALLHYFVANAWETVRVLSRTGDALRAWEQPEFEHEIINLRSALRLNADGALEEDRHCQVLTNLGNLMSHCGRLVDAVAYWDRALDLNPGFAMALGNRGYGLEQYARLAHDQGHKALLLRAAYSGICRALEHPLAEAARGSFLRSKQRLERHTPPGFLNAQATTHALPRDRPPKELDYRQWTLRMRLFLNDLNELGEDPVAAVDVLTLPSIVVGLGEGPYYVGYFNQMKQEYVSARYFYYLGTRSRSVHWSDRDVTLANTLDYPAYGVATEQIKIAFRVAYSLLDKVAFFLNTYLELGIAEHQVSFRKVWYEPKPTTAQAKTVQLRVSVQRPKNAALQALFWLSKDLYEREPGFAEALEPEARAIDVIRNHLEHKYLKLHLGEWGGPPDPSDPLSASMTDTLAFSLHRRDFEGKTLHLLRMARAALIYLSMAVYVEEAVRQRENPPKGKILPLPLDVYEDDWKA